MARRFRASLIRTRPGFWLTLIALVALLGPAAYLSPYLGLAIAGFIARTVARREETVSGELSVKTRQVRWNGERLLDREQLATALLMPRRRRRPVVALAPRRGAPIRFEVDGVEDGRELIRALGLDPDHHVATFSLPTMNLRSRSVAFALSAALGFAGLIGMALMRSLLPGAATLAAAAAYSLFVLLTRTRVHIGADGISIESLGARRFIEHSAIESVTPRRGVFTGVELALGSGEVVRLPTTTQPDEDGGLAEGIADLIDAAREGHGQSDAAREAAMLARGGRSAEEWHRALRSMAAGAHATHRTAPLDPERAFRVLEDPSAEASARVGAAALIGAVADEKDRSRLRVAAAAVAAPKVRIAIERAADSASDEELIEALEAVHEAKRRTMDRG
jgi:hypothetical protein